MGTTTLRRAKREQSIDSQAAPPCIWGYRSRRYHTTMKRAPRSARRAEKTLSAVAAAFALSRHGRGALGATLPTSLPTDTTSIDYYQQGLTGTIPTELGFLTEATELVSQGVIINPHLFRLMDETQTNPHLSALARTHRAGAFPECADGHRAVGNRDDEESHDRWHVGVLYGVPSGQLAHGDRAVRAWVDDWLRVPFLHGRDQLAERFDPQPTWQSR